MSLPSSPTTDQLNDVAYEDGVAIDGTVAANSFASWLGNAPATYSLSQGYAHKWANTSNGVSVGMYGAAGTAGGVVTYSFGSNVTADQQTAFRNALTLWSDETNVAFSPASAGATGDVELDVTNGGGTYNVQAPQAYSHAGSSQIPIQLTPTQAGGAQDTISFDNSGGFGTLGSFSAAGGYGESALVHEIGHMLGLGHTGPYDDGTGINPASTQYNAYDSRQWSIMSYVDPSDTAKYQASYSVKGTHWASVTGQTTYGVSPETPMIDDILAVQRLYGGPTRTALAGGQVFGFHCNITDGSRSFFDFSTNTNPVVTLFDTGANNTLDLSGFSTACTINLNPGTFSSAGGTGTALTNNIGIAYGTHINTAIGGSGNDAFIVNAESDTIAGGGGTNTVVFAAARSHYVIRQTGHDGATITNKATGTVDTVSNVQTLKFTGKGAVNLAAPLSAHTARIADAPVNPVCFVTGTRIRTTRGECAVENLVVGDVAITATGTTRPIVWVGHRDIDCHGHYDLYPVRVTAHAFGVNLPTRDLTLSPGHPVLIGADEDNEGGWLVPIMYLVNGTSIVRTMFDHITYWHVELDEHDILLAENLPAESYLDWGDRLFFTEGSDHKLVHPDFVVPGLTMRCRPVALDGPAIEAARRHIDAIFATRLFDACDWPTRETETADAVAAAVH